MHYVYLLRSSAKREQTYVGYTVDLRARLAIHNQGGSEHTAKFRPWQLEAYFAFTGKSTALAFEAYLKSHSGKALASKRLWSPLPKKSRNSSRAVPCVARRAKQGRSKRRGKT
jgi:putative endonuclease